MMTIYTDGIKHMDLPKNKIWESGMADITKTVQDEDKPQTIEGMGDELAKNKVLKKLLKQQSKDNKRLNKLRKMSIHDTKWVIVDEGSLDDVCVVRVPGGLLYIVEETSSTFVPWNPDDDHIVPPLGDASKSDYLSWIQQGLLSSE